MRCTPEAVVTDGGSSFISDAFKSKLIAILGSPHTGPAGIPQMRGREERFFSTLHVQLAARFTGRTFRDVVDRGGYQSEARAGATVDMLCWALQRWIPDAYHNTPHRGLDLETPANAWRRLEALHGVNPPPGANKLRHVFGIEVERATGPHGVLVLGLDYRCEALHRHRIRNGETRVKVRVDPLDLGHASVLLGTEWHTCACARAAFEGVSMDAWTAAAADLRRRRLADAKLTEGVMLDAIRAIQAMAREGIAQIGLGALRPSVESIDRAERDLFIGFRMPRTVEEAPTRAAAGGDLLSGAIKGTGPLSDAWLDQKGISRADGLEAVAGAPSPEPGAAGGPAVGDRTPSAPTPPARNADAETSPDGEGPAAPPTWSIEYD